jgi:autotransporter-associated beta strand protein
LLAAIENKIVLASDSSIDVVSTNATSPGKLNLFNEVSGPGRLVANQKAGLISREGFLYLAHSNTYSGGTTIEQGTLTVSSAISADANLGTGSVYADGITPAADFNPDGAASGKLAIESGITNAIADTAYLTLTGGGAAGTPDRGAAILAAGINETVGGLMLGGVIQIAGTYGSTSSGATFQSDEYFGGSGMITVSATACGGAACVPGDYNSNGVVDAADYVLWRKGGTLANDFTPGNQSTDYDFWRSRFGATTNPGSGSGLQSSAVPEPSTIALVGFLVSLLTIGSRRR